LRPDEAQQPIVIHAFELNVRIKTEGGQYTAVFKPLEHMLAGVGEDKDKAIEDFVDCFTTLVDFHIKKRSVHDFLSRYFQGTVRELRPRFEEDEEEVYKTLPVWQLPPARLGHAI
jgi:hypothetical protein